MNTIHFKILLTIVISCISINSYAQIIPAQITDTSYYNVSVEVGGGLSIMFNKMYSKKLNDIKAFAMMRVMWKPDKILNIGVEADYLNLMTEKKTNITTEFGTTDFSANLSCIPLNVVLSMGVCGFDIYAGTGLAFVNSSITAFNDQSDATIIAGSYIYGLSYSKLISKDLSIGLEAKGFFISSINKIASALIIKVNWNIYSY